MRIIPFLPRGRIVAVMAAIILIAPPPLTAPAWALNDRTTRATLKGVRALTVLVESVALDAEKEGLTKEALRNDAVLRLQNAGVALGDVSDPILHIRVDILKLRDMPLYTFAAQVEFVQPVLLKRDPNIASHATTWSDGFLGTVPSGNLRKVRDIVADLVEQFVKAYLEQNPK